MKKQTQFLSLVLTLCSLLVFMQLATSCDKKADPAPVVVTPPPSTTTVAPAKSSAKSVLTFTFAALSPAINGTIDNTTRTISATVAAGTDVSKLVPTLTISDKATVSPAPGVAQDFSKAVTYTVTAEDGTTQAYGVSVVVPPAPVVTTKAIKSNSDLPDVLEDLGNGVDYLVTANISITGTRVVTVRPGVLIQFEGGSSGFTISSQAALKMIGTAAKPIILEGKVASAGSWQGILVRATNIENQWEYVTVRHAGGNSQNGGLSIGYFGDATRISLKNCTFNTNFGYGVLCNDDFYSGNCFTGFANNTFTGNTKSALKIRAAEMGSLDTPGKYADNGQKYIEVAKQGTLIDDITVKKIDVPYRVFATVRSNAKITINAGVTIEFTTDVGFDCRYDDKQGAIVANGTTAEPIRLIGYLPNIKGLWKGFLLENGSPETSFTNCIIDGAGSIISNPCSGGYKAALSFGANPCGNYPGRGIVSNCTISNSGGYAIVFKTGDPVTVSNNTYAGNASDNTFNYK